MNFYIQLNMFDPILPISMQTEWEKEHIKNPPPINVSEEQRSKAQEKLAQIKKIKSVKTNL